MAKAIPQNDPCRHGALGDISMLAPLDKGRCIPIVGEYMAPALRHGDFVLAVPCSRYVCTGLYVIEVHGQAAVCRADARSDGGVWWRFDAFEPCVISRAEFDAMVIGYVAGLLKMQDADALFTGRAPEPVTLSDLRGKGVV